MAKKVVIVDEELTPTVLAIKKNKRGSILWLIIIFVALIAAAIYLPDITTYLSERFGFSVDDPSSLLGPSNADNDDTNDNESDESAEFQKYVLSDNPNFIVDDMTLSNFVIQNNTITFTITNNGSEIIDLSEEYYYLNLYNGETLLERIKVADNIIGVNSSENIQYEITSNNITEIAFLEITVEEYPSYTIEADSLGNGTLTCVKDYETITYSFNKNQLITIEDVYVVATTDPNYSTLYSSYQALSTTYSNINGVTSNIVVENNSLHFTTSVNLRTLVDGTFNNRIYYPLNTDGKVINFELESQGYICS